VEKTSKKYSVNEPRRLAFRWLNDNNSSKEKPKPLQEQGGKTNSFSGGPWQKDGRVVAGNFSDGRGLFCEVWRPD
jgi:hypothetical protein